jgi:hypothetical protein
MKVRLLRCRYPNTFSIHPRVSCAWNCLDIRTGSSLSDMEKSSFNNVLYKFENDEQISEICQ